MQTYKAIVDVMDTSNGRPHFTVLERCVEADGPCEAHTLVRQRETRQGTKVLSVRLFDSESRCVA